MILCKLISFHLGHWLNLPCPACHAYADRKCITRNRTVQYSTVQYSTIQYNTVQYGTVQHSTVQYSTVQCSTVQYSTYSIDPSAALKPTDHRWLDLTVCTFLLPYSTCCLSSIHSTYSTSSSSYSYSSAMKTCFSCDKTLDCCSVSMTSAWHNMTCCAVLWIDMI